MSDGRYIDERLGILAGEGAQQIVQATEERLEALAVQAQPQTPPDGTTYYERAVLKPPVWKWYIPAYFVSGGIAGAAATLGAIAQTIGGESLRPLVRRARWISTLGTLAGTAFLVADLGRPERFLNMLRVFRPTSPMSVGSWILAPTTAAAAASAIVPGPLGDVAGLAAGTLGAPLATYTATLTSTTAVPIWNATRRTLPWLYASSATSAAASLLAMSKIGDDGERVARIFDVCGNAGEIAASAAVENEAKRSGRVGKPLDEGVSGALWKTSKMCSALSVFFALIPRKRARRLSSVLSLIGSVACKFAIFRAGVASARDPRATFDQQRTGAF